MADLNEYGKTGNIGPMAQGTNPNDFFGEPNQGPTTPWADESKKSESDAKKTFDEGHVENRNKEKLKKLSMVAGAVVIFIVLFSVPNILGMMKKSNEGTASNSESTKSISQLDDINALKSQIAVLQNEKDEALAQIDSKVDERMNTYLSTMQENQKNSGISDEKLNELLESNKRLQADVSQIRTKVNEEKREPKEGSTVSSQIFTTVKEVKEAREQAAAKLEEEKKNYVPDFDVRQGLQTGMLVNAKLDTKIVSTQMSDNFFVTATTTEPFEIVPGAMLPAGTVFLGKPRIDAESRRITVDIVKLRSGSSELNIKGVLLDKRGSPGLVTKYVDPMNSAMWAAIPLALAGATAQALKSTTTYYNSNTGVTYEGPKFNTENALYQGLGDGLGDIADRYVDIQSKKKPIIIVESGIDVKIQISEKLGLEKLIQAKIIN